MLSHHPVAPDPPGGADGPLPRRRGPPLRRRRAGARSGHGGPHPARAPAHRPRPRPCLRRRLHGRRDRAGRLRHPRSARRPCAEHGGDGAGGAHPAERAMEWCAGPSGGSTSSTRRPAPAATWRTTTTSTGGSSRSSWTATGNIPAPTSRPARRRWRRRRRSRSATSPPSCGSTGPGLEVLDIGCGWGGMALTLARDWGARVTGITLSAEQLEAARARAEEEGLADRVRFELLDYRDWDRPVDRVVSVGMFEHVGLAHYRALLPRGAPRAEGGRRGAGPRHRPRPTGRAAPIPGSPSTSSPAATRPALSEVLPAVERAGPLGHRHRDPAPALRADARALARAASPATATPSPASTTSASAACSNSTWPAASWRSAAWGT